MTVSVSERGISRTVSKGQSPGVKTLWTVTGTDDESGAIDALFEEIPSSWDGYPLLDYGVERTEASDMWYGHADYAFSSRSSTLEVAHVRWNYSISSETERVYFALTEPTEHKAPGITDVPDFGRGIQPEWNGNKYEIKGVDLPLKAVSFQATKCVSADQATPEYFKAITDLAWHVNECAFRGYPAYEVLFRGIEASQRNDGDWEIVFSFQQSPNRTASGGNPVEIGNIPAFTKLGWQRVSVLTRPDEDANFIVQKPVCAYVETHYSSADFIRLGLD